MKRLSDALGVSRSHLSESVQRTPRPRGSYRKHSDAELLGRIEVLVAVRPSYGYRRITALLNRGKQAQERRVNHKRVYRVMRDAGLLLPKHSGKVERPHEGQVITLKSTFDGAATCSRFAAGTATGCTSPSAWTAVTGSPSVGWPRLDI